MKIYEVHGFDEGANRYTYFEPTRAAAAARKRAMKKDGQRSIVVDPIEVTPTREGIARTIQRIIDGFCVNEH